MGQCHQDDKPCCEDVCVLQDDGSFDVAQGDFCRTCETSSTCDQLAPNPTAPPNPGT